jgi:hypothetical protein
LRRSFENAKVDIVAFGSERPVDGGPLFWHIDVVQVTLFVRKKDEWMVGFVSSSLLPISWLNL